MSKAAELAALIGSQTALSNRNLVINGAMQVAQRGTSATVGPNGTGEGYTVVDRFQNSLSGSVVSTFSQSTDAPSGFANSAKIEITTADTSLGGTEFWNLRYGFEGQDLQSIAKGTSDAKALTVSFWVKSNKTGTYTVELQDTDNSRRNSLAYTIDSSNTWEHKSLTYNPDTAGSGFANDNALSLRINFWFVAGADYKSGTFYNGTWGAEDNAKRVHSSQVNLGDTVGNEWYVTGVQMELGEQATPFEHRSYADELRRCQRYLYQAEFTTGGTSIANGAMYNSSEIFCHISFPVTMRSPPTFSSSSVSNGFRAYSAGQSDDFASWSGIQESGTTGHTIYKDSLSSTGNAAGWVQAIASGAYIRFDAEL
tara:strand:- start:278 stop:1381 length:1104 start_codon:yes stop_codon:yes gene_type:complete